LYIVDEHNKPEGVVTLTDIMKIVKEKYSPQAQTQ
jgi:CBS domain containing-hemolysin-like protein